MTELSIRLAVESDLIAVVTLLRKVIGDMRRRGIDQWDEVYPTMERFSSDVLAGTLYVAEMGDSGVVGAFTLDQNQDVEYRAASWTAHDSRISVVHRLMVDPAFQGRGIARQLMGFAERLGAGLGCGVMRLDAFTLNPQALGLYRTLGYVEAGEVKFRKGVFMCFEKRLDMQISTLLIP